MDKLQEFRELKQECIKRAASLEQKELYEMAYISLWKIMEKGLSIYASEAVRMDLHEKIQAWDNYLSGKTRRKPKEIRNFSVEYTRTTIPQVSLVERVLGKMRQVEKIMEPKGRWRKRRNSIAHDAADFSTTEKYKEYKHELLVAIDELSRSAALHKTRPT